MTPEEFKAAVLVLHVRYGESDPEVFHACSDDLMEQVLTELWYGDGVAIITAAERWYV